MRPVEPCEHPERNRRRLFEAEFSSAGGRSVCGVCGELLIERSAIVEFPGAPPRMPSRFA